MITKKRKRLDAVDKKFIKESVGVKSIIVASILGCHSSTVDYHRNTGIFRKRKR